MPRIRSLPAAITAMILLIPACDDGNERLARMAQEHAQRQAEQTRETTKIQRELAEGARKLVEADARARGEMAILHRELQSERVEIGHQRDSLELDRRELASRRRMDPIIAVAIERVGMALVCVLPLIVCWHLLRHRPDREETDELVTQVLVQELVSSEPTLLAPRATQPALPCHGETDNNPPANPKPPSDPAPRHRQFDR